VFHHCSQPAFHEICVSENVSPPPDKVTGGWRKLHSEELRDLYSSSRIITIIKSRMMRWAGHVA
jgi:hypothetical protein